MPTYRYVAVDHAGGYVRGDVEAEVTQAAVRTLKDQGLWVLRLTERKPNILFRDLEFGGPRVPRKHLAPFCRQLSTLLDSGVPLADAVHTLSYQTTHRVFRRVLTQVTDELNEGTMLCDAASKYPGVFPRMFVSMVRAGETGGSLNELMERLAEFFEKEHFTREQVKAALTYPAFVLVTAVVVVAILVIFVIPRFATSFAASDMELPLLTKIVIAVSTFSAKYGIVFPLIAVLAYVAVRRIRKTEKGGYAFDYAVLRLPVIGKLFHKQALARFSRTFASLYNASVPLLEMLPLVSRVVMNKAMIRPIEQAEECLYSGRRLVEPFRDNPLYPTMIADMLAVGEDAGAVGETMTKLAEHYEREVDAMADSLKSLLEPVLMLVLSFVVGVIVLSVMLPTYSVIGNMN